MSFRSTEILYHIIWFIPLAFIVLVYASTKRKRILKSFLGDKMQKRLSVNNSSQKRAWRFFLSSTAILFLFIAFARPWWGKHLVNIPQKNRDLLVVLDTSRSMLAKDVAPSRMKHAKWWIKKLLEHSPGDRFGLVAFAGDAYTECPLTQSIDSFMLFLNDADTDTIAVGGTNIENALETAMNAFEAAEGGHKAIILITDGDELQGDYQNILSDLSKSEIPIFVVGIGDPSKPGLIQLENNKLLRDKDGELVKSRLNETALENIALKTNGIYVRSTTVSSGLNPVLEQVKSLVPEEHKPGASMKPIEKYQIPLFIAVIFLLIQLCIGERKSIPKIKLIVCSLLIFSLKLQAQSPVQNNLQLNSLPKQQPSSSPDNKEKDIAEKVAVEREKRLVDSKKRLRELEKEIQELEEEDKKNEQEIARLTYNSSLLHIYLDELEKAEEKLHTVVALVEKIKNQKLSSAAYQNLAVIKQKEAEKILLSDPDKALEILEEGEIFNKEAMRMPQVDKKTFLNQELLYKNKILAKQISKIKKELEKLNKEALKKTAEAMQSQQKYNSEKDSTGSKAKKQLNDAQNKANNAENAVNNYSNAAKQLKQDKAAKMIDKATAEINNAQQQQQELKMPLSDEARKKTEQQIIKHFENAIKLLGGQTDKQNKKQDKQEKDKNDKQQKSEQKKQQQKQQEKKKGKQKNKKTQTPEDLMKQLEEQQKQAKKAEKEDKKKFDKNQAMMLLRRMQEKEQDLREAIKKQRSQKNSKHQKIEKNW
ncbi:MAG: VWA domain-containing protein [Verrucomicrobiota bacterium]|nr:VWA domain-containing protein [Verrucomicrobiota bacterium]